MIEKRVTHFRYSDTPEIACPALRMMPRGRLAVLLEKKVRIWPREWEIHLHAGGGAVMGTRLA
jgi:hypothetical protein